MQTIQITNLITQTTDLFYNRNLDACFFVLKKLGYVTHFDKDRGCFTAFSIRNGYIDYEIRVVDTKSSG